MGIKGLKEEVFPQFLTLFSQDKEFKQLAIRARSMEVVGSFAMTELSHGSDVKASEQLRHLIQSVRSSLCIPLV